MSNGTWPSCWTSAAAPTRRCGWTAGPRWRGNRYWADAAFIAGAGIPAVLFGPDGDGAHAREEWVSLPGTVACARALTAAALDFCGGSAAGW